MSISGINPRWLLHGKGSRLLPKDENAPAAEDAASLIADLWDELDQVKARLRDYEGGTPPPVREPKKSEGSWKLALIKEKGGEYLIRPFHPDSEEVSLYQGDEKRLAERRGKR